MDYKNRQNIYHVMRSEKCLKCWSECLKVRNQTVHLDLAIDTTTVLRATLKKSAVRIWSGYTWRRKL